MKVPNDGQDRLMARRPPRGFNSWSSYNKWRVKHGLERGLSSSQALGHPRAGEVKASQLRRQFFGVPTRDGLADLEVSLRDATTVGDYLHATGEVVHREVDDKEFRDIWRGRGVGDIRFEHDPDRVRTMLTEAGPPPVERYRRVPPSQG
jgi:hypothetical protein